ncbi:hypothetical protein [Mesorhizobium sp. WSM3868]|uniref:hypothetical protein n=1 Tax=Mesorhizobium sp. WSM3868 TaxID=2029405 RepID=UPI00117C4E56|nr:hypothetical protein [Mesorhizobium sp. WSM3868]
MPQQTIILIAPIYCPAAWCYPIGIAMADEGSGKTCLVGVGHFRGRRIPTVNNSQMTASPNSALSGLRHTGSLLIAEISSLPQAKQLKQAQDVSSSSDSRLGSIFASSCEVAARRDQRSPTTMCPQT